MNIEREDLEPDATGLPGRGVLRGPLTSVTREEGPMKSRQWGQLVWKWWEGAGGLGPIDRVAFKAPRAKRESYAVWGAGLYHHPPASEIPV